LQKAIDKQHPGLVSILADGSLHLTNPLIPLNSAVSEAIRRSGGWNIVDASPLPSALKTKLKNQPVTFFLDLFDPLLDGLAAVLVSVMEQGIDRKSAGFKNRTTKNTGVPGVGGFVYDLSTMPFIATLNNPKFRNVNIWLYPESDAMFDEESRGIMLRLRSLLAYFVLFFRKPVELQAALARAALDILFPSNDAPLHSTLGKVFNKPDTAIVVDRIPGVSLQGPLPVRDSTVAGRVVFSVTKFNSVAKRNESWFYTLSPKGLYDRAVELQRDWDAKYLKYRNDKITNAAGFVVYGPRMTFLRSQGKTEDEARAVIAREDDFPKQFAEARNLPTQFRVWVQPSLGGTGFYEVTNGPRPALPPKPLNGFGNYVSMGVFETVLLAATPVATKTAVDAATPVAGAAVGGEIAAWLGGIASVITAVGGAIKVIVDSINATKIEEEKTEQKGLDTQARIAEADAAARQAEADAAARQAEADAAKTAGTQSESASGGFPVVPVAIAAGLALLLLSRR
jgi:hypothetical protein